MNSLEKAKSSIVTIYGQHCTYERMHHICGQWESRFYKGYDIKCGMFRSVIIPKNHSFIIKTGLSREGCQQCESEARLYKRACEAHVEQHFAKYYGKFRYHNHMFYVFEYVDYVGSDDEFSSFMDACEDETVMEFIEDNDINDLHYNNYGYADEERTIPVIVDYGGYY